jgi:hypothetical protein
MQTARIGRLAMKHGTETHQAEPAMITAIGAPKTSDCAIEGSDYEEVNSHGTWPSFVRVYAWLENRFGWQVSTDHMILLNKQALCRISGEPAWG